MEQVSQSFVDTYASLLAWALNWWSGEGSPGVSDLRAQVAGMRPVSRWVTAALLAVGLVVCAASLMIRRRGSDLADVLVGLARTALAVSAGWLVLASAWSLGDAVAAWILGRDSGLRELRSHLAEAATRADPGLALLLSIVGIACCLGFVAAVLARFVIAAMLVVGLPVLAAGSVTPGGPGLRTGIAWVVAVVAFQPLSAAVYRVGHGLALHAQAPVLVLLIPGLTLFLAASTLPLAARLAGGGR